MCLYMSPTPPTPPPPPSITPTPTPTPPTPPTTTTQHHPNINTPEQNTQVQVQVQVHHHHHQPPPPKSMRTSWCQPRVRRPEPIKFPSRSGSSCIAKTASRTEHTSLSPSPPPPTTPTTTTQVDAHQLVPAESAPARADQVPEPIWKFLHRQNSKQRRASDLAICGDRKHQLLRLGRPSPWPAACSGARRASAQR